MPNYFFDSSALVKRYRREAGSDRVNELLDSADRIIVARLTQLEVSAALVRRGVAAHLAPETLALTLAAFDLDLAQSLRSWNWSFRFFNSASN
jgi:predicted nucleic acid-binding protein